MLSWIILAQSATASGPLPTPAPLLQTRPACKPAANADELVVCGRDTDSPYRLKPLPPDFERPLIPKAETGLLGGRVAVEAEQGRADARAMIRMKWKF